MKPPDCCGEVRVDCSSNKLVLMYMCYFVTRYKMEISQVVHKSDARTEKVIKNH